MEYMGMGKGGDLLRRYGVEGVKYSRPGMGEVRTINDVNRDLAAAASKDYDTRRTIEALALTGDDKAEKWAKNSFKNAADVKEANKYFKKLHKKNGNGGEFSSLSDFAGLTYDSVTDDRKALMAEILKSREPKMSLKDEEPDFVENPYKDEPEGLDPFVKATKDSFNDFAQREVDGTNAERIFPLGTNLGQIGTGIPSPGAEYVDGSYDNNEKAESFAAQMKAKIISNLRKGYYADEVFL